jgi:hypothetical protein
MTAKTEFELQELLDEEFAWRRKELSTIRADLNSASGASRNALLRAGVALLYAHWEGFVKIASESYVQYVGRRRLKYKELCPGFLALALRNRLKTFSGNDDASAHVDFVQFLMGDLESNAHLPKLGVIKTGSNLNSKRLKVIVLTLGLDYSGFELKENLIDNQLLDSRNNIAHGRDLCPSLADFESLYQETTALLRNLKDQISNAVALRSYRASTNASEPKSSILPLGTTAENAPNNSLRAE